MAKRKSDLGAFQELLPNGMIKNTATKINTFAAFWVATLLAVLTAFGVDDMKFKDTVGLIVILLAYSFGNKVFEKAASAWGKTGNNGNNGSNSNQG